MNWRRLRQALGRYRTDRDVVAVLLPEPLRTETLQVYANDGLVDSVRLVRQRTGLDLLSATRAVRALAEPTA